MMKGGTDGEKVKGPLFPRLHVNDREKGGPRAPPRNKMALYEQFSIPSQKFNSSASAPHSSSTLVPSSSSSQGLGHERSVFSPFYVPPPTSPHSTENIRSCSSDQMNLDAEMVDLERKSMKNASYNKTSNFSSIAECSSFRPHDFSNSKNSSVKKFAEEDDFRVPTSVHSGIIRCPNKDQNNTDRERQTPFCTTYQGQSNSPQKSVAATFGSSIQLHNIRDKPLNRTNTTDLKSREQGRNQSEQRPNEPVPIKDSKEKSGGTQPSTGEKITEPAKYAKASLSQEPLSSQVNEVEHSRNRNMQSYKNGIAENGNVSRVRSESFSRASLGNDRLSPKKAESCRGEHEDKARGSLQPGDVDRNDDIFETSMVDGISGLDISPDDVVDVIGQKYFWKARRAIVSQQRAFAEQVFELHRLIKVQKLIPDSPLLLHGDYPYVSRPPKIPAKKLSSEYILKPQTQIIKQRDDSQKPSQNTKCSTENAVGNANKFSGYEPYSGNAPPARVPADNKAGAWCFPPPGNQWLLPVMSPSEGLVYKPYTGPCPPTSGFMAPVYGGNFMAPAYGVPASHQQPGTGVISGTPPIAQNYFSPYGVPLMNPVISAFSIEQVNPSAGSHRTNEKAEQLSIGEVNFNMHSRGSCNISNQKSEAFSCHVWKFQISKGSEVQGSTASSPCERVQGGAGHVPEARNALPLSPVAPATTEGSDRTLKGHSSEQQNRVIKVVPHNARSATESAARIFRSIQEERQQYDSQ
ncbi:ELF3-like protein 2 [Tasmannia lanceolata]|uniref:ELF3-like protein 2 n=1 Tax=Tasmannia lanceolata TaxID=3420 RepID=UPI0040627D3B